MEANRGVWLPGTACRRAEPSFVVRSVARPPLAPSPASPHTTIAGAAIAVRIGNASIKCVPRSKERATEGESIEAIEAKPIEPTKSIESIEGEPIEPMKSIEAESIEPAKSIESIETKPMVESTAAEREGTSSHEMASASKGRPAKAAASKGGPAKAAASKGGSAKAAASKEGAAKA